MPERAEGEKSTRLWQVVFWGILLVLCAALMPWVSGAPRPTPVPSFTPSPFVPIPSGNPVTIVPPLPGAVDISVNVLNVQGVFIAPLENVVVRVSDSDNVDAGKDGQLKVDSCNSGQFIYAWASGYETNFLPCDGQSSHYNISLNQLQAVDNTNYVWSSAWSDCMNCHGRASITNPITTASYNEVLEWSQSGHARTFQRSYFDSMYKGTTLDGKLGQPATPVIIENAWVPVPPEKNSDYHGPGYKLDFPQQPGNCAFCHAPAAIRGSKEGVHLDDPGPIGVAEEGVTCDVCHKVFSVVLDDRGFPFPNRPGIQSFQSLRPHSGVFMTGPFANIIRAGLGMPANHRSTCSPIFSQSEFCAPCHYGKFGDMVIYNSYGEWKASPYAADPKALNYRTCQDCHMSRMNVDDTNSLSSERQACSASDPRYQDFNHNMMKVGLDNTGKEIPLMVQNAATMALSFDSGPTGSNALDVRVDVTNTRAGHNFPTDSPLRHLILVIEAKDRVGTSLIQVEGPQIPNWAGPGPGTSTDYENRLTERGVLNYSGKPGKVFANLLVEEETNLSPGMAYWNETKYAVGDSSNGTTSDTRLRPRATDVSAYSFAMPDDGNVRINVKLLYRYAFYDLMIWKQWFNQVPFERADILVSEWECFGPPRQAEILRQSCARIGP